MLAVLNGFVFYKLIGTASFGLINLGNYTYPMGIQQSVFNYMTPWILGSVLGHRIFMLKNNPRRERVRYEVVFDFIFSSFTNYDITEHQA